jgi:8-oxo-dGTP pyrophosphatase MutT (NUDIX family)
VTDTMRESLASIAVIRRQQDGQTLWLAQWNPKWKRYHFVGGHRHADESFRQCVIREVQEELEIAEGAEFLVGERTLSHLDYIAWSEGAGQQTHYVMELFEVQFTSDEARRKVEADRHNRWLTETEIRKSRCRDGQPVSATMALLIGKAELFSSAR